jgi:GT2 family glycosyltransferase
LLPSIDYSIIIPAFNEEELLPGTIDYLQALILNDKNRMGEIIVVDNDSTDSTAKLAKEKNCRVVHEPFRQIAKARNKGASVARGNLLFFIDADTIVPESTFCEALHKMEEEGAGGGGSILKFDNDHGRFWAGKVLPGLWNSLSRAFCLFAGSFIFCRTELFIKSKGFPESHFAGEEIVFNRRLKKVCRAEGMKLCILTDSPVCSSARKLTWHNDWSIILRILPLIGLPWLLKSRKACRFWYERPKD